MDFNCFQEEVKEKEEIQKQEEEEMEKNMRSSRRERRRAPFVVAKNIRVCKFYD